MLARSDIEERGAAGGVGSPSTICFEPTANVNESDSCILLHPVYLGRVRGDKKTKVAEY